MNIKLSWNIETALLLCGITSFIFLMAMQSPKRSFYDAIQLFLFGWGAFFWMFQLLFPFTKEQHLDNREAIREGIESIRTTQFSHYLIDNEWLLNYRMMKRRKTRS